MISQLQVFPRVAPKSLTRLATSSMERLHLDLHHRRSLDELEKFIAAIYSIDPAVIDVEFVEVVCCFVDLSLILVAA